MKGPSRTLYDSMAPNGQPFMACETEQKDGYLNDIKIHIGPGALFKAQSAMAGLIA